MSMSSTVSGAVELSVVIPAYNESLKILRAVDETYRFFSSVGMRYEIIVVDDGSTDGTSELLSRHSAQHSEIPLKIIGGGRNRGKGFAVGAGASEASGRLLLVMDADLSTPLEEFHALMAAHRRGAGIAIGSRALDPTKILVAQPLHRRIIGMACRVFVKALFGLAIDDTQCGFKLYAMPECRPIFASRRIDGFGYDVELLVDAARRGIRIEEVPVAWKNDAHSSVNPVSAPIEMVWDLVRLKRRMLPGS